ncbi:polyprenyl synthetase family protein [Lutibacter sp. B2]|nr:polyprenyl synthetase family protein [Lutibacter sp. B2]
MDIEKILKEKLEIIEKAMDHYLPKEKNYQDIIFESMRYSIFAGGKRLRPILMMAACEFVNGDIDDVIPFACAMEMIHCYSLIHDDLPAMDDDDYRRGKLTNHKVYGDAIAILAGDGLLNYAYELMIKSSLDKNENNKKIIAMNEIASSAGIHGMIGGQVADLISENKSIDEKTLDFIHKNKTGALIISSIRTGAILGGATEKELNALSEYATNIGLGFQITDDILDIIGDEEKIGKKVGSDIQNNKATYPVLYGLDESMKKVQDLFNQSVESLKSFGQKSDFFINLADYLVKRDY